MSARKPISERPATETVRRESVKPAPNVPDSSRAEVAIPASAPTPRELTSASNEQTEIDVDVSAIGRASVHDLTAELAPTATRATVGRLPVVGRFGSYDVHGRLAFGGMAEIFLAREVTNGVPRSVVIKRVLPNVADNEAFIDMFLDEARLAIRLQHPNICHIYEFGRQDGQYFIAMEWVHGATLGQLLKRLRAAKTRIPLEISVKIIASIADALHYAHRARDENGYSLGIVHRDVTPHNVMVAFDGNVKLLDFGIAKAQTQEAKTEAGVLKGKFAYMSPEQCRGLEVDGRSDVFSLGICLYEVLTGVSLYHRVNEYDTLTAVLDAPTPSIRDADASLPAELDAIVKKALAKVPDERFQTAGDMQRALEQWLVDRREIVPGTKVAAWLSQVCAAELSAGPKVDPAVTGLSPLSEPARSDAEDSTSPRPSAPTTGAAMGAAEVRPSATKPTKAVLAFSALAFVALLAIGVWALNPSSPPQGAPSGTRASPTPKPPSTAVSPPAEVAPSPVASPSQLPSPEVSPGAASGASASSSGEANAAVHTTPAAATGFLSINTRPWSTVYVNGRSLGTTPISRAEVRAGLVRLRLVDRDGRTHAHSVTVAPSAHARVSLDLQ